jgi:hypothetical protein
MVLSGEIEVLATIHDEDDGYDGFDDQDDDYGAITGHHLVEDVDDPRLAQQAAAAMLKNVSATPFAHNLPSGANSHNMIHPRPTHGGPMIATNPSSVSYENPAMASLYEPQGFGNGGSLFMQPPQQQPSPPHDMEKGVWNPQVFLSTPQGQQQMLQQARSFLAPSHSLSNPPSASVNPPSNPFTDLAGQQAFLANFQRQQSQQMSTLHGYMSADGDDASSVGSVGSGRQRSRSLSGNGTGYCTPSLGSPTDSYDLSSSIESIGGVGVGGGDFVMVPRRLSPPGLQHSAATPAWCQPGDGGAGMMTQNVNAISVGGGGNGFLMMM